MQIEFTKEGARINADSRREQEWLWRDISRISVVAKSALKCIVRYLAVENTSGDFVEISSDNENYQSCLLELIDLGAAKEDTVVAVSTLLPSEGRVTLYESTNQLTN